MFWTLLSVLLSSFLDFSDQFIRCGWDNDPKFAHHAVTRTGFAGLVLARNDVTGLPAELSAPKTVNLWIGTMGPRKNAKDDGTDSPKPAAQSEGSFGFLASLLQEDDPPVLDPEPTMTASCSRSSGPSNGGAGSEQTNLDKNVLQQLILSVAEIKAEMKASRPKKRRIHEMSSSESEGG